MKKLKTTLALIIELCIDLTCFNTNMPVNAQENVKGTDCNVTSWPKGFSKKAPVVSVYTSYRNEKNKPVDDIEWGRVKGATGYKIYREKSTKNGTKLVLVKKVRGEKNTSVFVTPGKRTEQAIYHVQAYKKYKGKVYYGKKGHNTFTHE